MNRSRTPMTIVAAAVTALALCLALAASGCAAPAGDGGAPKAGASGGASGTGTAAGGQPPAEDPKSPTPDKVVASPLAPDAPKPGVTALPGGTSKAVGTMQLRQLEGGIWVVVDSVPGPGARDAKVLVVISDPELFDMGSLNGFYVAAEGTLGTGASTNMAGPQMIANTIAKVGYTK
jgi:hypothetical protein